jgi:hypothetical protein
MIPHIKRHCNKLDALLPIISPVSAQNFMCNTLRHKVTIPPIIRIPTVANGEALTSSSCYAPATAPPLRRLP